MLLVHNTRIRRLNKPAPKCLSQTLESFKNQNFNFHTQGFCEEVDLQKHVRNTR